MVPDAETFQTLGDQGGIAAIFAFLILTAAIWFLREYLKYLREGEEYRRKRDDAFLTTLNTVIAAIAELKNSVDKSTEVDRIVDRLRAEHADKSK